MGDIMENNVASNAFDKLKVGVLATIMIVLPSLKLLSYILHISRITPDFQAIKHVHVLWYAIPALLILYILSLNLKKDKITYLDIIMFSLAILGIISTIFAINVRNSIFGEYHRNEGILTLINYYLIFLNAKSIKNQKDKDLLLKIFL